MSVKNRPVIGTMKCPHCDGVRTVHETGQGAYRGYLYTRCQDCTDRKHKCIQRRDTAYQNEVRKGATFRDGFEQYAQPISPPEIPEPSKTPETPDESRGTDESDQKKTAPIGRGNGGKIVAAVVGVVLITIGVTR